MATADPLTPATPIAVAADPAAAGFDPARLERVERHFAGFVDHGLLPGWLIAVSRGGRVVYTAGRGVRDLETGAPVEADTIWRIYSMTKPVTSVAAMMLCEEGAFELKDPVDRFIPAFADAPVGGGAPRPPAARPRHGEVRRRVAGRPPPPPPAPPPPPRPPPPPPPGARVSRNPGL